MKIKSALTRLLLLCALVGSAKAGDKLGAVIKLTHDCKNDENSYTEKTYSDEVRDGLHDKLVIKWCDGASSTLKLVAPGEFNSFVNFKSELFQNKKEKGDDGKTVHTYTFIDKDTLGRYLYVEEKGASDTCRIYSFFKEARLSKLNDANFDETTQRSIYPIYTSGLGLYIQYYNPNISADWKLIIIDENEKVFLETNIKPEKDGWNMAYIPNVQLPIGSNYSVDFTTEGYGIGGTIRLK